MSSSVGDAPRRRLSTEELPDDDEENPCLETAKEWYLLPAWPERAGDVVVGMSDRTFQSTSLCGWRISDEPRKTCIRLTEWPAFDPIILVAILANCMTMAWESPLDPCCTWKAEFIGWCEWVFLFVFTFELLAKVFAFGFIALPDSYLRDSWCQLDFVVVTLAWIPILIPSFGNYSVFRAFRALRPLRALKRMPGIPVLVNSLLAAIPKLASVTSLVALLILVFGIVGTEEFKGALHYRCALPGFNETSGHPSMLSEYHHEGAEGFGAIKGLEGGEAAAGGRGRRRLRMGYLRRSNPRRTCHAATAVLL